MVAPARYWRAQFIAPTNGNINVARVDFLSATNVVLSTGGTPTSTASSPGNVFDGNNATVSTLSGPFAESDNKHFTYETPTAVQPAKMFYRLLNGQIFGVEIRIQSSQNGTDYVTHAIHSDFFSVNLNNQEIVLSIDTSTYNQQVISRQQYKGRGGIFGIVTEDSIPQANWPVYLLTQENMRKISQTVSDASGGYKFLNLALDKQYVVASLDVTSADIKAPITFDRRQPIVATSLQSGIFHPFWALRAFDPDLVWQFSYGASTTENQHMPGRKATGTPVDNYIGVNAAVNRDALPNNVTELSVVHHKAGFYTGMETPRLDMASTSFAIEIIAQLPDSGEAPFSVFFTGNDFPSNGSVGTSTVSYDSVNIAVTFESNGDIKIRGYSPADSGMIVLGQDTTNAVVGQLNHLFISIDVSTNVLTLFVNGTKTVANLQSLPLVRCDTGPTAFAWDGNPSTSTEYVLDMFSYSLNGRASGTAALGGGRITGAIAYIAMYSDNKLSDESDIQDLYSSFQDTLSYSVPYSGFAAQVAQDVPIFWERLQDATAPANGFTTEAGNKIISGAVDSANITYAASGFTASDNAVTFNKLGIYRYNSRTGKTMFGLSRIFSFSCWFNIASFNVGTNADIFTCLDEDDDVYLRVSVSPTGAVTLHIRTTSQLNVVGFVNTLVSLDTDYYLTVTYDPYAQESKLYLNGVLEETIAVSALISEFSRVTNLYIAGNGDGGPTDGTVLNGFDGTLAEVALYNRELPAGRISAHYDARTE